MSRNMLTNVRMGATLILESEELLMDSIAKAITNIIPITLFNKGKAGQIFEEVKKSGTKLVVKNNVAECVLVSPKKYVEMVDEIEDMKLRLLALERMESGDGTVVSDQAMMSELGITQKDLDAMEDVEIE